jgi:hypothetical protein
MHEANPWTAAHCIRIWGPIKKIRGSLQGRFHIEVGPSSFSFRFRRELVPRAHPSHHLVTRPRRTDDPYKSLLIIDDAPVA